MIIKRILTGIACALAGIVALVLISLGIMTWRLTSGPVSLGVFVPVMELVLNAMSDPVHVAVDDTVLSWNRSDGVLNVRLVNAAASSSSGEVVIRVPELSLGLLSDALLRGVIAPTQVEIVRPDVRIVRPADADSSIDLGQTYEGSGPPLSAVMSALAHMPDPKSGIYGLKRIRVVDGSVDVQDRKRGLSWQGTLNNTEVWREPTGISATSFLSVTSHGEQAELAMTGEFVATEAKLSVGLSFSQIRPALFASLGSSFASLSAIDLPVRGTLNLLAGGDGTIENLGFELLGGVGHLSLPVPVAQELGILAAAQRLAVRGIELNGTYESKGTTVDIDRLSIDVEPGQAVYLPAPLNHEMPLSAVRARGRYFGDDKRAELASLRLDLDGPEIEVTATADGIGTAAGLKTKAELTATNIQVNDLARYWPSSVATNAYEWCIEHLSEGSITEARVEVAARGSPEDMEVATLSGRMDIKGVSVDYLPPMPKVRNASGEGLFDLNSLTVNIASAESVGVSVRGGTAKLYDFGKSQEMADIDLSIAGPIPKILALIDHPPLGYAKAMDIDPTQTRGSASGRVRLQFPLLEDLPMEKLRVSVQAQLEKIFVAKIALGANVTDGSLTLDLTEKGMDMKGPVVVETTPAKIVWRENFETDAPFDTRLVVDVENANFSVLKQLKLEAATVIEEHIKGPLGVHVEYIAYPSGKDTVAVKADAKRASIVLPYFDWRKPAGQPGTGEFAAALQNQRLTEVSSVVLKSQGLDIQGNARYAANGEVQSANLSHLAVGRTSMHGTLAATPGGGWDIVVGGESLDIKPIIDALEEPTSGEKPLAMGSGVLSVSADLGAVLVDPEHPIKKVKGKIVRKNGLWNQIRIEGQVGSNSSLGLKLNSGENRSRTLEIRSSNAGDTLRSLGVLKHMMGGILKIDGRFDDTVAGSPLTGRVKISNYHIRDAPAMAKILSIMALTGILGQLRGEGIGFAILDAPFTLHNDVLDVQNARASGTEIGMTAAGRVANDTVNIKGTIVPFYAANSALGKIPILGPIFSGGDKGGGLFAARYSIVGPMDDPKVTVNPLSMLTPGFLRNLFNFFDSDSSRGSSTGKAVPREPEPEHP